MSRKPKYQLSPEAAFAAARIQRTTAPRSGDDEWKRGEDTEISAPPEQRPLVLELWALLTRVRTASFFVEPEEIRMPVVQRIGQIHGALLRSRTIKGYVGGTESRHAKKLLDSYGSKFTASATGKAASESPSNP
jgi:hypothetical protein